MADFKPASRVVDALALGEPGRRLLWEHGYELGEGFSDVLSRYQSLESAARGGRLRELDALVAQLNLEAAGSVSAHRGGPRSTGRRTAHSVDATAAPAVAEPAGAAAPAQVSAAARVGDPEEPEAAPAAPAEASAPAPRQAVPAAPATPRSGRRGRRSRGRRRH